MNPTHFLPTILKKGTPREKPHPLPLANGHKSNFYRRVMKKTWSDQALGSTHR